MAVTARPTLAVWKFTSCDGCQLTVLDCLDELLDRVDIAYFTEATRAARPGPYDLSLVEGSVTTQDEAERIQSIRGASRKLITIGACATAGGFQALRNFMDTDELRAAVYAQPEYVATLADSTPISAHVPVDFELHGCPIDRGQLLEALSALLAGRVPELANNSVCGQCKLRGLTCVSVASGTPCMGPVTRAGCNALCPSHDRGCFGCFGPMPAARTPILVPLLRRQGMSAGDVDRSFRMFNGNVPR